MLQRKIEISPRWRAKAAIALFLTALWFLSLQKILYSSLLLKYGVKATAQVTRAESIMVAGTISYRYVVAGQEYEGSQFVAEGTGCDSQGMGDSRKCIGFGFFDGPNEVEVQYLPQRPTISAIDPQTLGVTGALGFLLVSAFALATYMYTSSRKK